ncbi:MAG: hypothetical protein PWQ57_558 [Desulfovibrionales bacterium]|jgi:hypothetical protein|nr:hypothetical protein [Desulfovibrionales bacterium]
MSEELTLESLNLKKPLDKMTAKELRQLALEKFPNIVGASGMGKDDLVAQMKDTLGIVDDGEGGVSPYKDQIHSLKRQIRGLREDRLKLTVRKEREYIRRKINKLKKRTRRLAQSV